jgi:uncharacterized Tic20 family protein
MSWLTALILSMVLGMLGVTTHLIATVSVWWDNKKSHNTLVDVPGRDKFVTQRTRYALVVYGQLMWLAATLITGHTLGFSAVATGIPVLCILWSGATTAWWVAHFPVCYAKVHADMQANHYCYVDTYNVRQNRRTKPWWKPFRRYRWRMVFPWLNLDILHH